MWTCQTCQTEVEPSFDICWNCGSSIDGDEDPDFQSESGHESAPTDELPPGFILVTTPTVPGRTIERVLGVVGGQAIMGASLFADISASFTDLVGGRARRYESHLAKARRLVLAEMAEESLELGANAVVGVTVDYESLRGTMLVAVSTGTAVRLEPEA